MTAEGMLFTYAGDEETRVIAWLRPQIKGIALAFDNGLPEQCLSLIYSGIDTWGLLSAPSGKTETTRTTFMKWCEVYILPRITSVEGEPLAAIDLYGARCGMLHTSTSQSALANSGQARELWYQFGDRTGIRILSVLQYPALRVDVGAFALPFREGALACLADLKLDPDRYQLAETRAQMFLRWGIVL